MAEASIRRGSNPDKGGCAVCEGTGYAMYSSQLLDGTHEVAHELCGCLKKKVHAQVEAQEARCERGHLYFLEHGDELITGYSIRRVQWKAPSDSRPGLNHIVVSTRRMQACTCEDHQKNDVKCKHMHAVDFAKTASAICTACLLRYWHHDLKHVMSADGMGVEEGDWVCETCALVCGVEVA